VRRGVVLFEAEKASGFEDVGGEGIVVFGELHEVGKESGEFGVAGFAEIFLEAAPGFAGLERAIFCIGFFSELRGVGEGEFAEPALEEEGINKKCGAVPEVEFGGVVDGVHDGQAETLD